MSKINQINRKFFILAIDKIILLFYYIKKWGIMKKEVKQEIVKNMAHQLVDFDNGVYGCKRPLDDKMKEAVKKIFEFVEVMDKKDIEDFDLWVFVQYREGKMRSKYVRHVKLEPKTLVQAITEGFEVPTNATLIKFEVKPVIKNNYDVRVVPESIFETRFGLGKEENLTSEQVKRRYGLEEDENLFSTEDFKASKIFKFYKTYIKISQ